MSALDQRTVETRDWCPFCLEPLNGPRPFAEGHEPHTDEYGIAGHAACHDMDRSASFGDWITREHEE